ncbi:MAG: RNA methyltransferase [Myxococcales bacterium]|nr:RNA methyltransferase [Myxococcales bacterium]
MNETDAADAHRARLFELADADDPRIGDYRELREKNLERREIFLAESASVLRILVERATHPLASVLISKSQCASLEALLMRVPVAVPIYVASQAVLDAVAGFHLHRGVIAAAHRTPVPGVETLLARLSGALSTVVVLEGLTNHDNVGAIFRNAAALGADAVVLDPATCDPLYRKAIRVSVGAALVVPYARTTSIAALLPLLARHGFATFALTPNEPARDLREIRTARPPKLALVLGSEGPGLLPATLALCTERVRIPQRANFDSLNVATACGIALFELMGDLTKG